MSLKQLQQFAQFVATSVLRVVLKMSVTVLHKVASPGERQQLVFPLLKMLLS